MASEILVVYYSRTGHTKQLAERIAERLGADLEQIAERRSRSGILGYLRSTYETLRERLPEIGPTRDPARYRMVLVGTPIWDMSPSSPVRSYLMRHQGALRSTAFFCTCGGSGADKAFAKMSRDAGKEPMTTLVVRAHALDSAGAAIDRFVADVRTPPARPVPVTPLPVR